MTRVVLRAQGAFWRLWDKARANGAELQPGTVRLNWSTSSASKRPCIAPRWAVRIVGVRSGPLVTRAKRPDTIHRVRLGKRGQYAIDYQIPGATVTEVNAGATQVPENTLGAIEVWARCRNCENCLAEQRAVWVARCVNEIAQCRGRSWFVTLTMRPARREVLLYKAIQAANKKAVNWHELPAVDRQRRVFRAFYGEVQRYLKRVREELRIKGRRRVRFLAVIEPHKDGFPHAHLIVHEESFADANERTLRHKWWMNGGAKVRLVRSSQDAALYVAKYLAKGAVIVRGSLHYGRSEPLPLFKPSEYVKTTPPQPTNSGED